MKAIILAAGKGMRLGNLTIETNKILLPIGGRKIIEYVLDNLCNSKYIDEIFIAVSYHAKQIKNYFEKTKEQRKVKINIIDVLGWETGGDLKIAAFEAGIDNTFLVYYGDVLTEIDINKLIEYHNNKYNTIATITLFEVPKEQRNRFGIVEIGHFNNITKFIEKPSEFDNISGNLAGAGIYIVEPKLLEMISYGKHRMEEIFIVPNRKYNLRGYIINPPYWIDIGTPNSYDEANAIILKKKGILTP